MFFGSISCVQSPEMWRLGFKQFTGVYAMKISSKSIRLVAMAATVAVTGGAFAAFNMDATTAATITYASELKFLTDTMTLGDGGKVTTQLGAGMSGSQSRFIRLQLTNAAFSSSAASAPTTPGSMPNTGAFATAQQVVGGGTGDAFVVYQLTAQASGQRVEDVVTMYVPPLKGISTATDVVLNYKVYSSAELAAEGTTTPLYSKSVSYAKFATGLKVTTTANNAGDAAATVVSQYKSFSNNAAASSANTGILGTVLIGTTDSKGRDGSSGVTLSELLSTSTAGTLLVSGDFSAATSVFLGTSTCGSANAGVFTASSATVGVKQSATITLPTSLASSPYGTAMTLCYKADGTTAIPRAAAVSAQLTLVASGNSTVTQPAVASLGTVTRDGTTLQAPFVQAPAGWLPRIVLTNTGTSAAAYTGTVTAGPSNVTGGTANAVATNAALSGSIPAGGQVIIEGSAFPTFTQSQRGFVSFDIGGVNSVINGVYQLVNGTTGSISNTNMVRPSNAYGASIQ